MATLHLFKDRDRPKIRRGLQQRDHLGIKEISQRVRTAAGSYLMDGRWQPTVLLEAIGRGGADRRLRRRDRCAVCLSECHVEPHLMIGDMAAGQRADPFNEEIHPCRPVAITGRTCPPKRLAADCYGRATYGRATPSLQHHSRNNFLIQIVGRSHRDCR